jgi:hypothetical protein
MQWDGAITIGAAVEDRRKAIVDLHLLTAMVLGEFSSSPLFRTPLRSNSFRYESVRAPATGQFFSSLRPQNASLSA